jgi:hypothetical protein
MTSSSSLFLSLIILSIFLSLSFYPFSLGLLSVEGVGTTNSIVYSNSNTLNYIGSDEYGNILIPISALGTVDKLSTTGTGSPILQSGWLSGLTTPIDIKQDPANYYYYVMQYNTGVIAQYYYNGGLLTNSYATIAPHATGMVIDQSSNIFVWIGGWLAKVSPGSPPVVTQQWCGPPGSSIYGGGAIDSLGNLYIGFDYGSNIIYKCSTTVINSYTAFTTLNTDSYFGMVFAPNNVLYITTLTNGIQSISTGGTITTGIFTTGGQTFGIAFDLAGKL